MATSPAENLPAERRSNALAAPAPMQDWSEDDKAIIKSIFPVDKLTEVDFKIFCLFSKALDLNPIAKEIYPIPFKRPGTQNDYDMSLVTSIDALRRKRDESGKFRGIISKTLRVKHKDGQFITVPHEEYNPEEHIKIISGTIKVRADGLDEPISATAVFTSYCKTYNGQPSGQWKNMGDVMILKCAEALAYRQAGLVGRPGQPTVYEVSELDRANSIDVAFSDIPPGGNAPEQPKARGGRKARPQTPIPPEAEMQPDTPADEAPPAEAATIFPGEEEPPHPAEAETAREPEAATKEEINAPPTKAEVYWDTVITYLRDQYGMTEETVAKVTKMAYDAMGAESIDAIPDENFESFQKYCRKPLLNELVMVKLIPPRRG